MIIAPAWTARRAHVYISALIYGLSLCHLGLAIFNVELDHGVLLSPLQYPLFETVDFYATIEMLPLNSNNVVLPHLDLDLSYNWILGWNLIPKF